MYKAADKILPGDIQKLFSTKRGLFIWGENIIGNIYVFAQC